MSVQRQRQPLRQVQQRHLCETAVPTETLPGFAISESAISPLTRKDLQELQRHETKGNKRVYKDTLRSDQLDEVLQRLVSRIDSLEDTIAKGAELIPPSAPRRFLELQSDKRRGNKGNQGEVLPSEQLQQVLQTHVPRIDSPKRIIADEVVPRSQSGPRCFQEPQRKETKGNKQRYREVIR